ncbi:hypothetical protein D3C81_10070 [compost metagenome]
MGFSKGDELSDDFNTVEDILTEGLLDDEEFDEEILDEFEEDAKLGEEQEGVLTEGPLFNTIDEEDKLPQEMLQDVSEEEVVERKVFKKSKKKRVRDLDDKAQVITFFTTDNTLDRDDILTQTSVLIAKETGLKVCVIDLNPITATLDHFFNIDKFVSLKDVYSSTSDTGLKVLHNAIEKNIFSRQLFEEAAIKHPKYSNLHILTGLYDMSLFDELEVSHYDIIVSTAKTLYDIVILNISPAVFTAASYIALSKSDDILVISDANYTHARNSIFMLKYLFETLKISKEKVGIIINNLGVHSLDRETMKKIFADFNLVTFIPYNKHRMTYINNKQFFINSQFAKKDVPSYMSILEYLDLAKKVTFVDKLLGKFKKSE